MPIRQTCTSTFGRSICFAPVLEDVFRLFLSAPLPYRASLFVCISAGILHVVPILLVWLRVSIYKDKLFESSLEPVSIVVSSRNNKRKLVRNLGSWLNQASPKLEVVVANDRSWDGTADALDEFEDVYPQLQVVDVPEGVRYQGGKKLALTLAFKRATNPTFLLTDDDCSAASEHWASHMQHCFNEQTDLVLGYGAYQTLPGFLNKLIRFDTLLTAQNYFGFALAGQPYMGVGRNLAYRSRLFFGGKGFVRHITWPSGDDDLFVNEHATRKNTRICLVPQAFTISEPNTRFADWFRQKTRHMGSSRFYKPAHKAMLGVLPFTLLIFLISGLTSLLLADPGNWLSVAMPGFSLLFFLSIRWGVLAATANRLQEHGLGLLLPILDLLHFHFQFIWLLMSRFRKESTPWN